MSSDKPQRKPLLKMFKDLPPKVKWLIYVSSLTTIGIGYFIVVISAYLPEIGISPSYIGIIFGANSVSTIAGGMLLARGIYDLPFFLATGFYITGITLFYVVFKDIKPHK